MVAVFKKKRRWWIFFLVAGAILTVITAISTPLPATILQQTFTSDGNVTLTQFNNLGNNSSLGGIGINTRYQGVCEFQIRDNSTGGAWICGNNTALYTCVANVCTPISGGGSNNYPTAINISSSGNNVTITIQRNGLADIYSSFIDQTGSSTGGNITLTNASFGWPVRVSDTNQSELVRLNLSCSTNGALTSISNSSTCQTFTVASDLAPYLLITTFNTIYSGLNTNISLKLDATDQRYNFTSATANTTGTNITIFYYKNGVLAFNTSWIDQTGSSAFGNVTNGNNTNGYIPLFRNNTEVISSNLFIDANNDTNITKGNLLVTFNEIVNGTSNAKSYNSTATNGDSIVISQDTFQGNVKSNKNLIIGSTQVGPTTIFFQSPNTTTLRIYNSTSGSYMSLSNNGTEGIISGTNSTGPTNITIANFRSSAISTASIIMGLGLAQQIKFDGDHMESNGFIGVCPNLTTLGGTLEGCERYSANDTTMFIEGTNGLNGIEYKSGVLKNITFNPEVFFTGNITINTTAKVNGSLVCTADGNNCPAAGSGNTSTVNFTNLWYSLFNTIGNLVTGHLYEDASGYLYANNSFFAQTDLYVTRDLKVDGGSLLVNGTTDQVNASNITINDGGKISIKNISMAYWPEFYYSVNTNLSITQNLNVSKTLYPLYLTNVSFPANYITSKKRFEITVWMNITSSSTASPHGYQWNATPLSSTSINLFNSTGLTPGASLVSRLSKQVYELSILSNGSTACMAMTDGTWWPGAGLGSFNNNSYSVCGIDTTKAIDLTYSIAPSTSVAGNYITIREVLVKEYNLP